MRLVTCAKALDPSGLKLPESRPRAQVSAVLIGLLSACGPPTAAPQVLQVLQASPADGDSGVFLNERVEIYFSRPLDPASLHARSARILDRLGRSARGYWEVEGQRLSFTPDPVLSPELDDGGYLPGESYTVELAGFPRPDGLRALAGEPLARSARWQFRVVAVGETTERGFLFEDASLETGRPLILRSERIGPRDPILLEGEEPVDPSTLFGEDFLLQAWKRAESTEPAQGEPAASQATTEHKIIAVRARLLDNRDRRGAHARGTTWIELQPQTPLDPGPEWLYQIHLAPSARLRDFSGHPVRILPRSQGPLSHLLVVAEGATAPQVHFEPFFGTDNRSPMAVPGADGTAWWGGDSGRVEIRFPAAAGDGRDGTIDLGATHATSDLHALRIHQATEVTTELSSEAGPMILRAQGSLRLDGKLLRHAGPGEVDFLPGESLSAWLERVAREDRTVTVLIAGGDLVLGGDVDIEGPLLLAAGGRVRLVGSKWIRASALHIVGERGGQGNFDNRDTDTILPVVAAPLELDPPQGNPLVERLTFAVRSGPIPRQGRVARWHPLLTPPGGHSGSGSFRVRFLGERSRRSPDLPAEILVDDPTLLTDCPTLRLQVELELRPGALWDPPWVDFVEVSWENAGPQGGR
jgi:hypothetical protein